MNATSKALASAAVTALNKAQCDIADDYISGAVSSIRAAHGALMRMLDEASDVTDADRYRWLLAHIGPIAVNGADMTAAQLTAHIDHKIKNEGMPICLLSPDYATKSESTQQAVIQPYS